LFALWVFLGHRQRDPERGILDDVIIGKSVAANAAHQLQSRDGLVTAVRAIAFCEPNADGFDARFDVILSQAGDRLTADLGLQVAFEQVLVILPSSRSKLLLSRRIFEPFPVHHTERLLLDRGRDGLGCRLRGDVSCFALADDVGILAIDPQFRDEPARGLRRIIELGVASVRQPVPALVRCRRRAISDPPRREADADIKVQPRVSFDRVGDPGAGRVVDDLLDDLGVGCKLGHRASSVVETLRTRCAGAVSPHTDVVSNNHVFAAIELLRALPSWRIMLQ
jgi:hypothetical protein